MKDPRIRSDIPYPGKPCFKEPFFDMDIGDSLFYPLPADPRKYAREVIRVSVAASRASKRPGYKFSVCKVVEESVPGIRVWRVQPLYSKNAKYNPAPKIKRAEKPVVKSSGTSSVSRFDLNGKGEYVPFAPIDPDPAPDPEPPFVTEPQFGDELRALNPSEKTRAFPVKVWEDYSGTFQRVSKETGFRFTKRSCTLEGQLVPPSPWAVAFYIERNR